MAIGGYHLIGKCIVQSGTITAQMNDKTVTTARSVLEDMLATDTDDEPVLA